MPEFNEDRLRAIQLGFLKATRGESEEDVKKREEEERQRARREALERLKRNQYGGE